MNQKAKNVFSQIRLTFGIVFICSSGQINSQTAYALWHHHFWDNLLYSEQMQDGSIRFFTYLNQTNNAYDYRGVFGRAYQTTNFENTILHPLTVDTSYFNWAANEFYFQSLASGSVIVATNQFDCDFSFPGGICLVDGNDSIRWIIDLERMEKLVYVSKMVFVDEDKILMEGFFDDLVIDTNGVIIAHSFQGTSYDKTVQTSTGFLASRGNLFYVLSPSFDLVESFELQDEIFEIAPKGYNRFLIRTGSRSYEWTEDGDWKSLPESFTQAKFIWWDDENYWAAFDHQVVRYDTLFQPLQNMILPVGVAIKQALAQDSQQLVLAQYEHPITRGILLYEGQTKNLDFTLPYDIGITKITIPDTVSVHLLGFPFGVYTYDYAFVNVEVTNFGADTIFKYEIHSLHFAECDNCSAAIRTWQQFSPLLPGETRSISLGPYFPQCIYGKDQPLCLTTVAPNHTADGNMLNDTLCQSINHIILASKDPAGSFAVELFPNPVDDKINIRFPGSTSYPVQLSLMDMRGVKVIQEKVFDVEFEMNTSWVMPGPYLLRMENRQGVSMNKVIIQH